MNHISIESKVAVIILCAITTIYILDVVATAYHDATTYPYDISSIYDLWNISSAESRFRELRNHLINNGWVSDSVEIEELDYICCMASQLSSHYDDISPGLVLAMIAVESRFVAATNSSAGARGLMQLIPSYHEDRLTQFLEEDERYSRDLFDEPLYNIMTGMDYLHQLLDECDTNLPYALMCYNQGPSSGYNSYVRHGITSNYAMTIIELSVELDGILGT